MFAQVPCTLFFCLGQPKNNGLRRNSVRRREPSAPPDPIGLMMPTRPDRLHPTVFMEFHGLSLGIFCERGSRIIPRNEDICTERKQLHHETVSNQKSWQMPNSVPWK